MFGKVGHDLHSSATDVKLTSNTKLVENEESPTDAF